MEHFTPNGDPPNYAQEVTTLVKCKRCDDDRLAWKKSSRTGKWYLCDVLKCGRYMTRDNPRPRYFVLARLAHKCL